MILDEEFPPDHRVLNEAKALHRDGHEVFLFCPHYEQQLPSHEELDVLTVHRLRMPAWVRKLGAFAYTLPFYHQAFKKGLQQFIDKVQPDCLHIHDMRIAQVVKKVAKDSFKGRIVLDLHENRPVIMEYYPIYSKWIPRMLISLRKWKKKEEYFIRWSTYLVVVTDEARDYYCREYGVEKNKIYVLPNTVSPDFYNEIRLENDLIEKYTGSWVMLYIGKTGLRRGIGTVVEALPQLIAEIPNIKFVVLGDSQDDPILFRQVQTLGVSDYVDFLGWTDQSKFHSYIKLSKVGLCPFLRNTHHDTTFANKMFQYLSLGLPVIASDCEAQANVIRQQDCGEIFLAGSAHSFSEAVLKLYHEEEKYQQMARNASNYVRNHFNWSITGKELQRLYQKMNSDIGIR